METNYFVCTLGQAACADGGTPFQDVNHLIDVQASNHPELPAVGFYTPRSTPPLSLDSHVLTFREVDQLARSVAELLSGLVDLEQGQTVGLLAASSPAFMFTWLALIHLGHPVLLVAPQCTPSAIAHLSKACSSEILLHDAGHADLAVRATEAGNEAELTEMRAVPLPFEDDSAVFRLVESPLKNNLNKAEVSQTDIAYLHHTSGTSTGIPKPIPQSHRAAVGVLPSLNGSKQATFTTTPLYHGGVADTFRAWSSSALIWLFPGQHLPITATNIVTCIQASNDATRERGTPSLKYFSSVPYVLQMMAQDAQGLRQLQTMDIVGVGGAALPSEVGNQLVNSNVNLISRFGSAECGFLMSSHRDYEKDKEWQYLRRDSNVEQLKFEAQESGQSELIILDGWPHMAKRNRDDGSFATADLFAPHPDISNAWKYHSRADSQLTLITGKKFDPAPLEGSITASSRLLKDVLIFGNGKPYPGVLLFRSETAASNPDQQIVEEISPIIEKLNIESQSHARIPRNMLIPMPYAETPLEKSSKGTILRGKAEEQYEDAIETAYERVTVVDKNVSDAEIPNTIQKIVESIIGASKHAEQDLDANTELFSYGVDSVACVQIRHVLSQMLPKDSSRLPLTVVEDSGTIAKLSELVLRIRHRQESVEKEDQRALLERFVKEYSPGSNGTSATDGSTSEPASKGTKLSVLLTGPTGSLGSHVLSQLSQDSRIKTIYLLVRGSTPHAARRRVIKALQQRSLPLPLDFDEKVIILPCKLSEPQLGISRDEYSTLVSQVDVIFHLAWSVNFLLSLRSIASTHLVGLKNLLDLSLGSSRNPRFLFCSSVASVSNLLSKSSTIPESIVASPSASGPTGYALSKLAAELICHNYSQAYTKLQGRISVVRVGQLAGDTTNGVWSHTEAYPLMLGSSKTTHLLPDIGTSEKLNWLPVDIAAEGFIEAAFSSDSPNDNDNNKDITQDQSVRVLHLLNPSTQTTFSDLLVYLKEAGVGFNTVSPADWVEKLEALAQDEKTRDHPALKLLGFWKGVYGSNVQGGEGDDEEEDNDGDDDDQVKGSETANANKASGDGRSSYEMARSFDVMPSIKSYAGPLSKEYILLLWRWIEKNIA